MTTFPLNTFWDTSKTEGEASAGWFYKCLDVWKEMPGGAEQVTELTISSGSITPTYAAHTVDTEGDASTDDLANIIITNHPEARRLLIRAENTTRDVVIKHLSGGSGQISLKDGSDLTLDNTNKWIEFILIGTTWYEINSNFPIDLPVSVNNGGTGLSTGDNLIKGWVSFDGTAGTIVPNSHYNVASITDNGVGNYTINWDTNFADGNYVIAGFASIFGDIAQFSGDSNNPVSAGSAIIRTFDASGANLDCTTITVIAIGDQ